MTASALAAAALAASFLVGCGSDESGTVLIFYTPADGAEQYRAAAEDCSVPGQYRVEQRTLPRSADEQRLQLARRLAGDDRTLDIMALDVVWTAEFAEAGWALPLPEDVAQRVREGTLPGALATAEWQDQLYAAPLNTNTQLLWYRKDLVPTPPQTWDEMIDQAEALAAQGKPAQIMVQGAQYEGLTVWFNSVLASAGGSVVAEDGTTVTLADTPEHRAATQKTLEILKRVATARDANPSLAQSNEATSRDGMERGVAAFQVNYPFVLASIKENAIRGAIPFLDLTEFQAAFDSPDGLSPEQQAEVDRRVDAIFGWAPYPAVYPGEPAKVTIGGLNIAVASTSEHQDIAFGVVECLRNEENQRRNAIAGGVPPTLERLYSDPEFQAAYPAWEGVLNSLRNAAVRPVSPAYQSISILLSATLHPVAELNPAADVDRLAEQVRRAVNSEGLVP